MADLVDVLLVSRPLIATVLGVAALLAMILIRGVNAFASLLTAAFGTGLLAGLAPEAVISSVSQGIGGVLGFIAVIVGLGALLGAISRHLAGPSHWRVRSSGNGLRNGPRSQSDLSASWLRFRFSSMSD